MVFHYIKYKNLFLCLLVLLSACLQAQIPDGYYRNANGKKGAGLKTALFSIINKHTMLEYYSSSTSFRTTDWHPATDNAPNGYYWDMYSSFQRISWSGMNREHSLPKSWFGIVSGSENSAAISTDLHNLYPSDATANSAKSNYPLGEVAGNPRFTNGVVKVGVGGYPGYSGTVFEPADEYKGDFARDYMYMVTCYEDYSTRWQSTGTSSMLIRNTYPVLNTYAVNLLLKWHRKDPVSEKELRRNNAVFNLQGNRNPFIDHPELAEFVWGKYMNENWSVDWVSPDEEVAFKIDPFPIVSNELVVRLNKPDECIYYIRSVNGVTVMNGKFTTDGKLNVERLQNGLYILQVYTTFNKRIVAKFIVRH